MADAGNNHLRFKSIIGEDRYNLLNQLHSRLPDIIQSADERADIGRPAFAARSAWVGEKTSVVFVLIPSETKTLIASSLRRHRNFDDNVFPHFRKPSGFLNHPFGVQAYYFKTNGQTLYDLTDLLNEGFEVFFSFEIKWDWL